MTADILLLALGMAVVTFLPRALPALLAGKLRPGPRMEKFLRLIPYTAMAALIFPGILSAGGSPAAAAAAGAVAGVLAWRRMPLILCVLAAVAICLLVSIFPA